MAATKDRLMQALADAGAPIFMLERCARGGYDDYLCEESATPCLDLHRDAQLCGLADIVAACERGEFDASTDEANAWWERTGRHLPGAEALDAMVRAENSRRS